MSEILTSRAQWAQWAEPENGQKHTRFPYILRDRLERRPESWLQAWKEASPYAFVLESGKEGRYTFLGLEAESVIRGTGGEGSVTDFAGAAGEAGQGAAYARAEREQAAGSNGDSHESPSGAGEAASIRHGAERRFEASPLDALRGWMEPHRAPRVPGAPKFCGGAVGFLAYDVARSLERLPALADDDLAKDGLPDYAFMRLRRLWILDHQEQTVYCSVSVPAGEFAPGADGSQEAQAASRAGAGLDAAYAQAAEEARRMLARWREFERAALPWSRERQGEIAAEAEEHMAGRSDVDGFATAFGQEAFEDAVRSIQEYIRSGDVFQVNLSLRKQRKLTAPPEEIYEWMRLVNPSPYMGFLRFPDFQLVSGSPELLVRLEDGRLAARPIAGTRRRGANGEEDRRMAEELTGSDKERAEHIMLVDLQRNDLGRVAAYGSVTVPELMTIERYAHVMHLVSQVEADLAPGKSAYDVIAGVFPGGTITGAPKVRTMQIVEELEPVRRGPYTGSMGWIDYGGNMELNIIIRTLVVQSGVGHMQAGAGIVIDSDPYREYRECHNKARSVGRAVWCAERAAASAAEQAEEGKTY
ncbi:anthranilate synthase component I [Saccharibacillus sp. O23]|uniref:anthranilate synthase component I family protein n=1 Tax=Saccharibacillus sp. O23 TaxID=2009338 RepID=UPI000B4DF853|nr:anthranilate synthase component I family protein [Saccharibacillus sp. O23]OWR27469.1 anthranilate synthase component I [Saccharibacillus sp. O23]